MSESAVMIVVDPAFGARLRGAAASQPVWIAQIGSNREEAEKLWRNGVRGVTTFVVSQPFHLERAVAGILGRVLEHHPGAREVRVVGCAASESLRETFAKEGLLISDGNHEGFVASSAAA